MPVSAVEKIWKIRSPDPCLQAEFSNALHIHPIIAQLLVNRGVRTSAQAAEFLRTEPGGWHDPFLMKDMDQAVRRIRRAAETGERVMVFGDYDVDGVSSSAIIAGVLAECGVHVEHHIPHRVRDGYGLNTRVTGALCRKGITLLIAVDCGITAVDEVDHFNANGIDVVILDHHEPGAGGLPRACAVIDPKRADCSYPFKYLASVGLAAKLAQAMHGRMDDHVLDLVALGTIADVVPLRGENRLFVKAGLPFLGKTRNLGLAALMDVARIKHKPLNPYSVGFILGPRLNATGRMDSAHKALDLLLSRDHARAYALAQELEALNTERQRQQRAVIQEAMALIEQEADLQREPIIVLGKEGWHKGVLGIVASRIVETYERPAIVISLEDGVGTASARSVQGFPLHEALAHCSQVLETFGGHQLAAGLTIQRANIGRFRTLVNDFAREILTAHPPAPFLDIDCEVPLDFWSVEMIRQVDRLEPYGEGNPPPLLCTRGLTVKGRPRVLSRETLKFWVSDGMSTVSVVGFGMGSYHSRLRHGQRVDLVYQPVIDDWNKAPAVQLKLKDVRESGT